ncbi:MAG: LamG-like jellyroll fold domain-containing protein [Patescibacteria group bacterium]
MKYLASVLIVALAPVFSYGAVDLESNLIGHWKFDEGAGNTAYNVVSAKYSGKLDNGPAWADGKFGKALYFDSNDDAVEIIDSADIAEGAAIAVSIWMKPLDLGAHREVVTKHKSDNSQWQWRLEQLGSNRLSFSVQDSKIVSAESDSKNILDDKNWHHVVGVYDNNAVHLYVDGTRANAYSPPLSGKIADYKHHVCVGSAWAGNNCGATDVDNFYGYLDDLKIYDRALTAEEVKELFNPTPAAPTTAPPPLPAPLAPSVVEGAPTPAPEPAPVPTPTPVPTPVPMVDVPQVVFSRDLSLGSTGEDVRELQKFLNNQGFAVSPFGVGSPGSESDYFGTRTKTALVKFQENYKNEILIPVGRTTGTGYFGPSTRKKINEFTAVPSETVSLQKQIADLQALIQKLQQQINAAR